MEPVSEFTEQLFLAAGVKPERIITFSCDHVIPPENIISNILTCGPTGVEFEFNFKNRQNTKLVSVYYYDRFYTLFVLFFYKKY